MTGLDSDRQEHLNDLIYVANRLAALRTPEAVEVCHDCDEAITDLINGCDCDDSASALGAAWKLLGRAL